MYISDEVVKATEKDAQKDPASKRVFDLTSLINEKTSELNRLQGELFVAKKELPTPNIKWRDSVKWCLEIDSENPRYFLKSTVGVYNCIAFKHGIDITADIRNKIATTLSQLFMEKILIGRYMHGNTLYYGMAKFFKENLTDLKDEYIEQLDKLILQ